MVLDSFPVMLNGYFMATIFGPIVVGHGVKMNDVS